MKQKKAAETIHLVDYGRLQSYNNNSFYCLLLFDGLFLFVLCLIVFFRCCCVHCSCYCRFAQSYFSVWSEVWIEAKTNVVVEEEEEEKNCKPFAIWAACVCVCNILKFPLKTRKNTQILPIICNSYPIPYIIYFNCDIKVNILREIRLAITNKYTMNTDTIDKVQVLSRRWFFSSLLCGFFPFAVFVFAIWLGSFSSSDQLTSYKQNITKRNTPNML